MLSKTSVDEIFMHHFEKKLPASRGQPPDPYRGAAAPGPYWGTSVLQTPRCPPLEKIMRAPTTSVLKYIFGLSGRHSFSQMLLELP